MEIRIQYRHEKVWQVSQKANILRLSFNFCYLLWCSQILWLAIIDGYRLCSYCTCSQCMLWSVWESWSKALVLVLSEPCVSVAWTWDLSIAAGSGSWGFIAALPELDDSTDMSRGCAWGVHVTRCGGQCVTQGRWEAQESTNRQRHKVPLSPD